MSKLTRRSFVQSSIAGGLFTGIIGQKLSRDFRCTNRPASAFVSA